MLPFNRNRTGFQKSRPISIVKKWKLSHQEIQDVPSIGRRSLIQFCITTAGTGNGNEFFILDVKDFGKISAGCLKLVAFKVGIAAFRADVLLLFHKYLLHELYVL